MSESYIGEIRLFAGNFAPAGWSFCHGQVLPISENETLYYLIGTTYGGDGVTTYALPDLRGRVPMHRKDSEGYPVGLATGVEQVYLTRNEMPSHAHPLAASRTAGNQNGPGGAVLAAPPGLRPYTSSAPNAALADAVLPAGGSQSHPNMQPYLALNFIIAIYGIFPSQS